VITKHRTITVALALALAACKGEQADAEADDLPETPSPAATDKTEAPATPTEAATVANIDRLLTYLPTDAQRVAYDRLSKRFHVDVLAVVFALPPHAAHLLDEQVVLDEGLDIVLDGDAEPGNWLAPTTLGFVLPLGKSPYFLRPLSKPAAEIGPLLEQAFTKSTVEGVDVWLPTGSFPWRVALLEGDIAAFVPRHTVGTGLEPLLAAREAEPSALEAEMAKSVKQDPAMELLLFAVGPLVHFDVSAPIAQVDFMLRRVGSSYDGQVRLRPAGSVDECIDQLRARKYPEENQQVQALIGAVQFLIDQNMVVGQLEITPDRLKHFLDS
jgi:hypothetical protein